MSSVALKNFRDVHNGNGRQLTGGEDQSQGIEKQDKKNTVEVDMTGILPSNGQTYLEK